MSKSGDKQLYFLAVIPPEPVYSEAQQYKEYFAAQHNSKAPLKSPPHITLHMPFRLKPEKEGELLEILDYEFERPTSFEIELDGFGHFNQRVIYINVNANKHLEKLHKDLIRVMKLNFNVFNADYKDRGFNPHLTVAFRDLKKSEFKKAWPEYKEKLFSHDFNCTQFSLLKHRGKHWEVFKEFELAHER